MSLLDGVGAAARDMFSSQPNDQTPPDDSSSLNGPAPPNNPAPSGDSAPDNNPAPSNPAQNNNQAPNNNPAPHTDPASHNNAASPDDPATEISGKPEDDECIARLETYITHEKKRLGQGLLKGIHDQDKKFIETVGKLFDDGCPGELAMDISLLLFYDLVILIDDSASMASKKKMTALQGTLNLICDVYKHINEDGIKSVRYINQSRGRSNVTAKKVEAVMEKCARVGMSRIGTELRRKVLQPFALGEKANMVKPLLIVVISDGTPEGEEAAHLERVIIDCVVKLGEKPAISGEAVAFHFDRIGQDKNSIKLFEGIDDHEKQEVDDQVDSLPADIDLLEVSRNDEWQKKKWELIPKLLIGAIVPYWDKHKAEKDDTDFADGDGLTSQSRRADDEVEEDEE